MAVFVLNVMFTIEIWSFRNKTLSLHSKSYPVVINPSSKLSQKIHDWSIVVNNKLFTLTTKSLLRQSILRFNIKVFFEEAAFLSTLNSLLQRLVLALSAANEREFFPFTHRLVDQAINWKPFYYHFIKALYLTNYAKNSKSHIDKCRP